MPYVAFAPRLLFVKYAPITNINPPINLPIRFFRFFVIHPISYLLEDERSVKNLQFKTTLTSEISGG